MLGVRAMKSRPLALWATATAIGAIAIGGFCLGAFAWFGGYVWVKQAFGWFAVTAGLAAALLCWRAFPKRWPLHISLFVAIQCLSSVAVAAGQVFYFGPGSPDEAAHLFGVALRGGL